jgi:hypothetical protein
MRNRKKFSPFRGKGPNLEEKKEKEEIYLSNQLKFYPK